MEKKHPQLKKKTAQMVQTSGTLKLYGCKVISFHKEGKDSHRKFRQAIACSKMSVSYSSNFQKDPFFKKCFLHF